MNLLKSILFVMVLMAAVAGIVLANTVFSQPRLMTDKDFSDLSHGRIQPSEPRQITGPSLREAILRMPSAIRRDTTVEDCVE